MLALSHQKKDQQVEPSALRSNASKYAIFFIRNIAWRVGVFHSDGSVLSSKFVVSSREKRRKPRSRACDFAQIYLFDQQYSNEKDFKNEYRYLYSIQESESVNDAWVSSSPTTCRAALVIGL